MAARPGPAAVRRERAAEASFGGLIALLEARPISSEGAGNELQAAWRVEQRPSVRVQPVVERLEPAGTVGVAPAEPYPSGSWEAGEVIVARLAAPLAEPSTAPNR